MDRKSKRLEQKSIDWLYDQIYELHKGVTPPYQRTRGIWPLKTTQSLIDSILNGYDIPKLYFRTVGGGEFEVLDGQQRLKSIFSYKKNLFSLNTSAKNINGVNIAGCKLYDLKESLQSKFKSTLLDICWLDGYTDVEAADYYQRLQQGISLNPVEKRHADVESNMGSIVTQLSEENRWFEVLGVNDIRYVYEDIISKMLYLHLEDQFVGLKPKEMAAAYRKYKDLTYDDPGVKKLIKALKFIKRGFTTKHIKLTKNYLITIPYIYTSLSKNYNLNSNKIDEFTECYIEVDNERVYNKDKPVKEQSPEIIYYVLNMRNDGKTFVEARCRFLEERFIKLMGLVPKDKKRFLDKETKEFIRRRDHNICQICGNPCVEDNWTIDHINAHSNGGITSIENSQLLCKNCNSKKNNN